MKFATAVGGLSWNRFASPPLGKVLPYTGVHAIPSTSSLVSSRPCCSGISRLSVEWISDNHRRFHLNPESPHHCRGQRAVRFLSPGVLDKRQLGNVH